MLDIAEYQGTKDPDIIIVHHGIDGTVDPRIFDIYSPGGSSVNTIQKTLRQKANTQADRIVLNLENVAGEVDLANIQRQVGQNKNIKEVIIVDTINNSEGIVSYTIVDVWTFNQ